MKLAVPYSDSKCPVPQDKINEYNIVFKKTSKKEKLLVFLRNNKDKRINVLFEDSAVSKTEIVDFFSDFNNFYVRLQRYDKDLVSYLRDNNIKFFFDASLPVYSYLLLDWVIKQKPTDVYVTDDLCFNIKEVSDLLHKNGINLRIILNRCPTTNKLILQSPIAPIYSPKDFDYLSLYYDVAEFDCTDSKTLMYDSNKINWKLFEVLYKRWFIEKKWTEDLGYLNKDLFFSYNPSQLPIEMTENKLNCHLKCMTSHLTRCSRCKRYFQISEQMNNERIVFDGN